MEEFIPQGYHRLHEALARKAHQILGDAWPVEWREYPHECLWFFEGQKSREESLRRKTAPKGHRSLPRRSTPLSKDELRKVIQTARGRMDLLENDPSLQAAKANARLRLEQELYAGRQHAYLILDNGDLAPMAARIWGSGSRGEIWGSGRHHADTMTGRKIGIVLLRSPEERAVDEDLNSLSKMELVKRAFRDLYPETIGVPATTVSHKVAHGAVEDWLAERGLVSPSLETVRRVRVDLRG